MNDKIFTVKDLQDYLKLGQTTILKILREGKIKAKKVSGNWRILKSEADKFLKDFDN